MVLLILNPATVKEIEKFQKEKHENSQNFSEKELNHLI